MALMEEALNWCPQSSLGDGLNLARAYPLDIHLGQRPYQGLLAALISLEELRAKAPPGDLVEPAIPAFPLDSLSCARNSRCDNPADPLSFQSEPASARGKFVLPASCSGSRDFASRNFTKNDRPEAYA